jgi:Domain of unknown function (DUF6265)
MRDSEVLSRIPLEAAAHAPRQSNQSPRESTAAPQIGDLSWLAGFWTGKWGPRTAEQFWMPPHAGFMVGSFRLFEDSDTLLIELFTFAQKDDGIELRFRHFTPALVPWEKSEATVLVLRSLDSKRAIFENTSNGEPKRAIFIRVDPDTYISRSEIVSSGGTTKVVEIKFHRQHVAPVQSGRRH